MNPAVVTGAAALSIPQLADIIMWVADWPIKPPPQNVALALAGVALAAGHAVVVAFGRYFPPRSREAPVVPAALPAPPVSVAVPAAPVQ